MSTRATAQLALDEKMVEDGALEAALEERQKRLNSLSAVRAEYKEAAKLAEAEIAKLNLAEGDAIRIGKWRITRTHIPARSVSFDAEETSRIRIELAE